MSAKAKEERIAIRMDSDTKKMLEAAAERDSRTLSSWCYRVLRDAAERELGNRFRRAEDFGPIEGTVSIPINKKDLVGILIHHKEVKTGT